MRRNRPSALCTVLPLSDALGNAEIGVLLDAPLLINPPDEDLVLTSDQWAALLGARRAAGRAVHYVEMRQPDAEEHGRDGTGAGARINMPKGSHGKGRGRVGHAAHGAPRMAVRA